MKTRFPLACLLGLVVVGLLLGATRSSARPAAGPSAAYPATLQHVLTVAATAKDGTVAQFSSASPVIDVAAPGVDIPIAKPLATTPSGYGTGTGASYAAAIIAGAAAWVWTMRPSLQASQVAELLRRSARPLGSPVPNDDTGYGMLDVAAALRTPAPPPDQLEPSDDIVYALPLGTPNHGSWPLTTPRRAQATITASVTAIKDPVVRVGIESRPGIDHALSGDDDGPLDEGGARLRPARRRPAPASARCSTRPGG